MKKQFAFLLIGIITLIILAYTLQILFNDQIKNLEIACASFLLSIFCLCCYKYALDPSKEFGPINTTKKYYEKKGELYKYKNLCKSLFIITVSVGTLALVSGLGEILITYIKSLFAN